MGHVLVGWVIGMAMAVAVLSALFESHIYAASSGYIRLNITPDFRCIYSGDYGSKGHPFPGTFVYPMPGIFRMRCTHRGGHSCEGN